MIKIVKFILIAGGAVILLSAILLLSNKRLSGKPSAPSESSNKKSAAKSQPASVLPVSNYNVWRDPSENAFQILVPANWQVTGSVVRPYLDAMLTLQTTDSNAKKTIFFGLPNYPFFIEPIPGSTECYIYQSVGQSNPICSENNWYSAPSFRAIAKPFYTLYRKDAVGYIRDYLFQQNLTAFPTSVLIAINNRPDLIDRFKDNLAAEQNAAEALFEYEKNGATYQAAYEVVTNIYTQSGLPNAVWISYVSGVEAPKDEFQEAQKIYSAILPTLKIDSTWLAKELKEQEQRAAVTRAYFRRLTQQNYKIFMKSYTGKPSGYGGEAGGADTTDESGEASTRRLLQTMGGSEEYKSEVTGETYSVPIGAKYWWEKGKNDIIGTNDTVAPDVGYNLMDPL